MKGFVAGLSAGLIVSTAALSAVSLLAPAPQRAAAARLSPDAAPPLAEAVTDQPVPEAPEPAPLPETEVAEAPLSDSIADQPTTPVAEAPIAAPRPETKVVVASSAEDAGPDALVASEEPAPALTLEAEVADTPFVPSVAPDQSTLLEAVAEASQVAEPPVAPATEPAVTEATQPTSEPDAPAVPTLDDAEFEPPTVSGPTDEPPLVTLVAPAAPLLLEPAAPADQPSLVEPPSGVPARPEVLAAAGPDLASRPVPGPTPPAAILAEAPVLPEAPLPLAEPEGDLAAPPAPELAQAGSPSLPTASVPDSADLEAAQVPAVEPPSAEGADAPAVLAVAQSDPAEPPSPGPEPLPVQAPAALPQVLPATPGPAEEAIALDEATPSEPEPPAQPAPAAVRILRLGAAPAAPEEPSQDPTGEATEDTADAPAAEAAPLPEDAPALLRHAAPFAPPAEARPLLSVILVDEGLAPPLPQVLAALPVPVSVAIDPALPDAAERLAAYRAQGIEALVVASLPELAKPQDAAVFLGAAVEELPDTVALLDLGQGGLSARNATAQMGLSIAARTGQGVVMAPQGFNSGLAAAQSQGVPAVQILRDLDSAGQDNPSIRRSLDDAVRRAGQGAQPVLLGRIRPDTLQAIADWTAEGRAEEVTVAPISALLVAQLPPAEDPPVEEETAAAP